METLKRERKVDLSTTERRPFPLFRVYLMATLQVGPRRDWDELLLTPKENMRSTDSRTILRCRYCFFFCFACCIRGTLLSVTELSWEERDVRTSVDSTSYTARGLVTTFMIYRNLRVSGSDFCWLVWLQDNSFRFKTIVIQGIFKYQAPYEGLRLFNSSLIECSVIAMIVKIWIYVDENRLGRPYANFHNTCERKCNATGTIL